MKGFAGTGSITGTALGEKRSDQRLMPQEAWILSNAEIADRLTSLAQLLSTQKENPYKVKAYSGQRPIFGRFQRALMSWCAKKTT
jgi:hypothetical protein